MNVQIRHAAWAAVLLSVSPLLASCTTQAGLRQAISDREAEIRGLREERAALKGEIHSLRSQLDVARADLAGTSAKPVPAAAPAPQSYPDLDQLGIGYGMRDGNLVITIPSSITFRSGSADVSKDGMQALKTVATTLRRNYAGGSYHFEGHTDTDPIKKSGFESNRQLSIERAMAVLTYLVEQCGIPDERCVVAGYGQYEPVAPNDSDAAKAKNRRVEIVVLEAGR